MATQKQTTKKPSVSSNVKIGLVVGGLAAAAVALFVAPKIDQKKRKEIAKKAKQIKKKIGSVKIDETVKDIFGETSTQSKKIYEAAKDGVALKIAQVQDAVGPVSREKYAGIVSDVVEVIKKEYAQESKRVRKLKDQLLKDWSKLDSSKKKTPAKKTVTKKTVVKKTTVTKSVSKKPAAKKKSTKKATKK